MLLLSCCHFLLGSSRTHQHLLTSARLGSVRLGTAWPSVRPQAALSCKQGLGVGSGPEAQLPCCMLSVLVISVGSDTNSAAPEDQSQRTSSSIWGLISSCWLWGGWLFTNRFLFWMWATGMKPSGSGLMTRTGSVWGVSWWGQHLQQLPVA